MKLYYKCPNCKNENGFKEDTQTRVELAMKLGKNNKFTCENCNKTQTLEINTIYTKESKFLKFGAGILFMIATLIGIYLIAEMIIELKSIMGIAVVAGLLLVPSWAYLALQKEDRLRVKSFNQSYL